MRTAEIARKTAETDITLKLNLDGTGKSEIRTGVGFMDHMLTLFARHGRFDIELKCDGDTYVDDPRRMWASFWEKLSVRPWGKRRESSDTVTPLYLWMKL